MRTLLKLATSFVTLALGCAASAPETTVTDEAAVAVARVSNACAKPQVSADGAFVVLDQCRVSDSIQLLEADTGRLDSLAAYGPLHGLRSSGVGTEGRFAWAIVVPTESVDRSGWSVVLRDLGERDAASARFIKPVLAGAIGGEVQPPVAQNPGSIVFTPDQKQVAILSGYPSRFLTVASTAASGPGQVLDLGATEHKRSLIVAPDGSHLLVLESRALGGGAILRRVDLVGAPVLGPKVEIGLEAARVLEGSYDGTSLLATSLPFGSVSGVFAKVDPASGAATTLDRIVSFDSIGETGGAWVYVDGDRRIKRVARDGSAPLLLADTGREWPQMTTRLSSDGSALLYTAEAFVAGSIRTALWVVPTSGSAAPRNISLWGSRAALTHAGKGRVLLQDASSWEVALLDDVQGVRIETYQGRFGDEDARSFGLSADGTTVYQARACNSGPVEGVEVVRVSGYEQQLVPCQLGHSVGSAMFTALPNRAAVALQVRETDGWTMVVRP